MVGAFDIVATIFFSLVVVVIDSLWARYYTLKKPLDKGTYAVLWYNNFVCFLAIPLLAHDIAQLMTRDVDVTLPETYLVVMWNIVYWSQQLLSFVIIPLAQDYYTAGEFTFFRRLLSAIISNLALYIGMGVVAGVFVIVLLSVYHVGKDSLIAVGIAAANAFGLTVLMLMLGYGLVEFPRYLWHQANPQLQLDYFYFKASQLYQKISDIDGELFDTLAEAEDVHEKVRSTDELRPFADILMNTCWESPRSRNIRASKTVKELDITRKYLAKLHERVKYQLLMSEKYAYQFEFLKKQAFYLQDIMSSANNENREIRSALETKCAFWPDFFAKLNWYWHCKLRNYSMKIFSIFCAILSLLLVYCELSTSITNAVYIGMSNPPEDADKVRASLIALLITACSGSRILVLLVSILVLLYIAQCAYFTTFKLKVFNIYELVPHYSDVPSLFFAVKNIGRIISPLCWNFTMMAQLYNQQGDPAFVSVLGKMDMVPVLGKQFNIFYPILLFVFVVATLFNLFSRIAKKLNIKKFQFEESSNDETIHEGKEIMQRERKKWDRQNTESVASQIEKRRQLEMSSPDMQPKQLKDLKNDKMLPKAKKNEPNNEVPKNEINLDVLEKEISASRDAFRPTSRLDMRNKNNASSSSSVNNNNNTLDTETRSSRSVRADKYKIELTPSRSSTNNNSTRLHNTATDLELGRSSATSPKMSAQLIGDDTQPSRLSKIKNVFKFGRN